MNLIEVIRKKRDRQQLSRSEISSFVKAYLTDSIHDYQMAAFLMAAYLNGLSEEETAALTEEMLFSGKVVDFSDIDRPKVDKHSTGGVGDKTSLLLAPLIASLGGCVPMISGRALGHSGGTLDKLEAIPGFNTQLSLDEFRKVVKTVGACIIGQTEEIAPADRRIYAIRDTTATVESIGLITASIMSKKLAEGVDALVFDVKCGSGAFMQTEEAALNLAKSLVHTAERMGKAATALITDMNQPLGYAVGNALEVIEAVEAMKGAAKTDFLGLCIELAARMLVLSRLATDLDQARLRAQEAIASGAALDKFRQMVEAQGADARFIDDYSLLPQSRYSCEVVSETTGYVKSIDTRKVGLIAMSLGAGRSTINDEINYAVGLHIEAKIGDYIEQGQPLCKVFYDEPQKIEAVKRQLLECYEIGFEAVAAPSMIKEVV